MKPGRTPSARCRKSSTAGASANGSRGPRSSAIRSGSTARDDETEVGRGHEQRRDVGRRADRLLEVVEDEKELAAADLRGSVALAAQALGNLGHDQGRLANRRELDEAHPVFERLDELGRGGDREARLADSAGAGERDEPRPLGPEQAQKFSELGLTPEQRLRVDR